MNLREAERGREKSRDMDKLFLRQGNKATGVLIEARYREHKYRAKAFGDINKYMENLGKEMERKRGEAITDGASIVYAKAKAQRFASEIEGARERSKGDDANQRATVDRTDVAAGRERYKAKSLQNILDEEELRRDGIINEIEGFRRDEEYFDRRIEDIGVRRGVRGNDRSCPRLKICGGYLVPSRGVLR